MDTQIISPQKIRFLKYIHDQEDGIKSGDIAGEFGIRTSTVTWSLHELGRAGYIRYDPYQKVSLTENGLSLVRYLYRRHRILCLMFTRAGLSDHDACQQAGMIEHLVSRRNIDQICRSLGHPRQAACGIIEHDPACCGEC